MVFKSETILLDKNCLHGIFHMGDVGIPRKGFLTAGELSFSNWAWFGWFEWGGALFFLKANIANLLFLRSKVCFGL